MKGINHIKWTVFLVITLLSTLLLLAGCTNLTPLTPQPQANPPSTPQSNANMSTKPLTEVTDFTVTYNYKDTDKVQLSANNLVLKVGQKLALQPAPGVSKNTRFISSGDYFFGNVMKQETDNQNSNQVIFTAINPGKGILQIIPDTDQTDRAVDLTVTVQ